jgi:hypothetical protein
VHKPLSWITLGTLSLLATLAQPVWATEVEDEERALERQQETDADAPNKPPHRIESSNTDHSDTNEATGDAEPAGPDPLPSQPYTGRRISRSPPLPLQSQYSSPMA